MPRNGALLHALHWGAHPSSRGLRESAGIMVNYACLPDAIEANHSAYVKTGAVCIYFPITDPGVKGRDKVSVGIEKPDWIESCSKQGLAEYVGREQVSVGGEQRAVGAGSADGPYCQH